MDTYSSMWSSRSIALWGGLRTLMTITRKLLTDFFSAPMALSVRHQYCPLPLQTTSRDKAFVSRRCRLSRSWLINSGLPHNVLPTLLHSTPTRHLRTICFSTTHRATCQHTRYCPRYIRSVHVASTHLAYSGRTKTRRPFSCVVYDNAAHRTS